MVHFNIHVAKAWHGRGTDPQWLDLGDGRQSRDDTVARRSTDEPHRASEIDRLVREGDALDGSRSQQARIILDDRKVVYRMDK